MKIFVIGYSNSGKTTLTKRIARTLDLPIVHAGEWVEALEFDVGPFVACGAEKAERTENLTEKSVNALRYDPNIAVRFMTTNHNLTRPCVIDGIRNPRDFMHLFHSLEDIVVLVNRDGVQSSSAFESGVDLIKQYLQYLEEAELLLRPLSHQVISCTVGGDSDETWQVLEKVVHKAKSKLRSYGHSKLPTPTVHTNIEPFAVDVRKEYLYDMDPTYEGEFVRAQAFALTGYPHDVPTFTIVTEEAGAMFSYLPPSALKQPDVEAPAEWLTLRDLVYHNCPRGPITVITHHALMGPAQVYLKRKGGWMEGQYVLTIDWFEGNDLMHLIALENGQYAFQPSHKVLFGNHRDMPDYRKLHSEWKV